jgi:hypothetical protein
MKNPGYGEFAKACQNDNSVALKRLNEQNAKFWSKQSKLLLKRASEPHVIRIALEHMRSEEIRGVTVKSRKTFELALIEATDIRCPLPREYCRKGGKISKTDDLQVLILKIVRQEPYTSQQLLCCRLRDIAKRKVPVDCRPTLFLSVDTKQLMYQYRDGKLKSVTPSALKDRLYRAKRRIKSREPG